MKVAVAVVAGLLTAGGGCASHSPTMTDLHNAMPGGWSAASTDDAKVKIAAQRAIAAQSLIEKKELALAAILEAQRQVVAGLNYKLRLSVVRDGKTRNARAIVWAKLDQTYELTEWSWE